MSTIQITITDSTEQIISGIPKSVTIEASTPSSIFYTLDGSDPDIFSEIYLYPVLLPREKLSITLKVLAMNGIDTSEILTKEYGSNILNNTRLPHSATDTDPNKNGGLDNLYPFGTGRDQPVGGYLNPAEAGITSNDPSLPQIPSGFDGSGNPTGFTNKPYNSQNYNIVYSSRNALGQPTKGNAPGEVSIEEPKQEAEETSQFSNLFDPRALVIFQDFSKENPNEPSHVNRQFFAMQDDERIRDGNNFFNAGLDSPTVTGSFVRSFYNQRDNTMSYYYFDSSCNRWIISKSPYIKNGDFDGNLAGIIGSRALGSRYIYQWIPFARRHLF